MCFKLILLSSFPQASNFFPSCFKFSDWIYSSYQYVEGLLHRGYRNLNGVCIWCSLVVSAQMPQLYFDYIHCYQWLFMSLKGFPRDLASKESACNAGDPNSIPGLGRPPGEGISCSLQYSWASLVAQMVKNLPSMWETWVRSLGWEDPLEGGRGNPLQYSCLENPHGQRSLAGYSSWDRKESYTTEQLSIAQHTSLNCQSEVTKLKKEVI